MTILALHGTETVHNRLEDLATRLDILGAMLPLAATREQIQQISETIIHAAAECSRLSFELRHSHGMTKEKP